MIKKVIALCILVSTLLVFVQCKEKTKNSPAENKEIVMEKKQNNLVGDWKALDVTSTIEDLATYVMSENNIESPIKKLSNVSSQVVSGQNYRFQILLENGENWQAQVYVNIQKEPSITTFKQIKN